MGISVTQSFVNKQPRSINTIGFQLIRNPRETGFQIKLPDFNKKLAQLDVKSIMVGWPHPSCRLPSALLLLRKTA